MIAQSGRVDVVLDCVSEQRDGQLFARVFVRGVFTPDAAHPLPFEGAARNVVQTWLGIPSNQQHVAAFAIEVGRDSDLPGQSPHAARSSS